MRGAPTRSSTTAAGTTPGREAGLRRPVARRPGAHRRRAARRRSLPHPQRGGQLLELRHPAGNHRQPRRNGPPRTQARPGLRRRQGLHRHSSRRPRASRRHDGLRPPGRHLPAAGPGRPEKTSPKPRENPRTPTGIGRLGHDTPRRPAHRRRHSRRGARRLRRRSPLRLLHRSPDRRQLRLPDPATRPRRPCTRTTSSSWPPP